MYNFLRAHDEKLKILFDHYQKEINRNEIKNLELIRDFINVSLPYIALVLQDYIDSKITDNNKVVAVPIDKSISYSINYYPQETGTRFVFKLDDSHLRTFVIKENEKKKKYEKHDFNSTENTEKSMNLIFNNNHAYVKINEVFYSLSDEFKKLKTESLFSFMEYYNKDSNEQNRIIQFKNNEFPENEQTFVEEYKYGEQKKKYFHHNGKKINYKSYYQFLEILLKKEETNKLDNRLDKYREEIDNWESDKESEILQIIIFSCDDHLIKKTYSNILMYSDHIFSKSQIEELRYVASYFINRLVNLESSFIAKLKQRDLNISKTRTAIISILVDSFAHNISAHSLAALKWWIEIRANKIYDKRIRLIKKDDNLPIELLHELQPSDFDRKFLANYAERSNDFFEAIGLDDSSNDEDFTSLQEIIQFMDKDLESKALTYSAKDNNNNFAGKFHFPIPIDHVMWKFMRFMRDKAAFWSGVTRDLPFGGEIKNLYTVLWNDFADNPLYLGTIAHSEQINKIIIHVDTEPAGTNSKDTEFAIIDMSVIEYEEQISNNEKHIIRNNEMYSHYMMAYPGKNHEEIRKRLQSDKYNVFFPGGIVGEHALFTLFENTLRNVKHLKVTESIKKDGLNFKIKIRSEILKSSKSIKTQLFEFEVLLDEKNTLFEGDKKVVNILREHTQKEVVTSDGGPRLGGNSQDKICAAMLFNNQFVTVEPKLKSVLSQRDHEYYNEKEEFYWIGFKEDADNNSQEIGKISKYFYLWKGEYIFTLQSEEDFDAENLSRFKFLYINTLDKNKEETLYKRARENGIIRVIKSSDINRQQQKEIESLSTITNMKEIEKIHKNIYDYWLDKFCFDEQVIIAGKPGKAFHKYEDLVVDRSIDQEDLFIIDHNRIRSINEESDKNCEHIISFAHGNNTCPKRVLDFRSHGKLAEYFYKDKDLPGIDFIDKEDGYNKTSKASEFIECITTKVHIFDNRIYDRIPENKYDLYRNMLNLTFNKEACLREEKQDFQNYGWFEFKNLFSKQKEQINILIMHLSFIEALKDSDGIKYNEKDINRFIEKEILNLKGIDREKFILVITTGRGRYEWQRNIDEEYAKFTIFRPIESLLSAVEDAVSFKDDFQIKFNLMKVIFGS